MGIEPTSHTINMRLNDFEDRGHHQVCKHFRKRFCSSPIHTRFFVDPFFKVAEQAANHIPAVG